jgi:hypothetical protein
MFMAMSDVSVIVSVAVKLLKSASRGVMLLVGSSQGC